MQLESELTEVEQLSFYFSDIKEKHGQISFHWGVGYDADSKVEKIIDWAEMQTL